MKQNAPLPGPAKPPVRLTPMFEQYLSIKAEHEDALLFFRMGDFYELFFGDAEVASRELGIALTSRNAKAEDPIPMCGVPYHAAENYIRQLTDKGYRVAVCDQVEDPKQAKGLVKRAVSGVRTAGTAVMDESLEAKGHNYLGALYWNRNKGAGGFAWLDYSTGYWSGLHSRREADLWDWVRKMLPRELLLPDLPADEFSPPSSAYLEGITPVRLHVRAYFDLKAARERILDAQNIQELGAVGLQDKEELVQACGAILSYAARTQMRDLTHIGPFAPMSPRKHLVLDEITERNLEIFHRFDGKKGQGTLWHVLDETITPMGGRLLEERLRHPWRELKPIEETAAAVAFFHDKEHKRLALRDALKRVFDLERLMTRIHLERAMPRDFIALRESLSALADVKAALEAREPGRYPDAEEAFGGDLPPAMAEMHSRWDNLEDVAGLLHKALVDEPPQILGEGGLFRQGYHPELDEVLDLLAHGAERVNRLLLQEQERWELPKLKLGNNRVFGYYFELTRSQTGAVPEHFIRKQTIANGERYITPELKELEDKILSAGERRSQMEYRLFQDLRRRVDQARSRILFMAGAVAALDFWQGLAETARKRKWTRPALHEGLDMTIRQGRHPVVEDMAGPSGFTPNDLYMDDKRRIIIITGPNMSGKSTALRQVAIMTILAQMGSFVPAAEARIGLADRIFSRVGASDNLSRGQSTFMVEMMETARILRQATRKSLVILDEIGRGTSTFDGLSLAWAVVEDLAQRGDGAIRTLFATHYHELTDLEARLPGVHNMNFALAEKGGDIIFLRRLLPGPSDKSYGVEVAKLAGVPQRVVQRARVILDLLSKSHALGVKQATSEAMQQLLPGLEKRQPKAAQPAPLLPERTEPVAHPLFTTLRDLDTDNLTPMRALALINEWKLLWGGKEQ